MELFTIIAMAALFAAGIIFMEIKFAKMNKTEEEQREDLIPKVLRKFGATEIFSDGKGWFNFWLDDECL